MSTVDSTLEAEFIDKVARIAYLAHEANRAYCFSTGDNSQPFWEDAPAWQRVSAITGVLAHLEKDMSAERSHEIWMKHKEKEGWVYGPVKDPVRKEHPCMVPYSELPEQQRIKDAIFSAVVKANK